MNDYEETKKALNKKLIEPDMPYDFDVFEHKNNKIEKYDLIKEFHYGGNWYYATIEGDLLVARRDLVLPNHPMVCMKTHNKVGYFKEVNLEDLI